jgi:ribulose-phosphate 3-epimerase
VRIAPSLLAADFANLGRAIEQVEGYGADLLHIDVMDGHFVPNISIGVPVIQSLRRASRLFFDAHLMISEPARYAEAFVRAGCDHLTFHIEAIENPKEVVRIIHDLGISAGVSLNPTTPAKDIWPIIDDVQMVLIMSVWPGFGGQDFIPDVLDKTREIRHCLRPDQRLQMDGGIDATTIGQVAEAGVDVFVAGTAVFGATDPVRAIEQLRQIALEHQQGP